MKAYPTIVCPRCNGREFSVYPAPTREEPYRCELECVVCRDRLEMQLHLPVAAAQETADA